MKTGTKTLFAVLTLFTILTLLIFWPIFLGKVNLNGNLLVSFYPPYGENLPYKLTGWDQLRIYFPFLKITIDELRNFQLPFWNPYAFSGHPHLADFQTAVFYPLNIFGFFLDQLAMWHLLRLTPAILASFFTFLFLNNLKLSRLASFFGAMTFGFSPFILTWGEEVMMSPHSIVWLPLILWASDRYLALAAAHPRGGVKGKTRLHPGGVFLAIIAFSSAFSLLGGYIQTSIYMFIFAFAYLIFRVWQNSARVSVKHPRGELALHLRILGSITAGIAIAAVQILPSAELYFNSARAQVALRETLFQFLLPIESLLSLLAPDFFGHPATHNFFRGGLAQYYEGILFVGVAPLVFALWAVFFKNGDRLVKFLAIAAVISLSTAFDLPTSRLLLSVPIPFLSTSIANRVLFVPAFCLAILAAVGFEAWLKDKARGIFKVIWVLGAVYLLIILYLLGVGLFGLPYFERISNVTASDNALITLRNLAIPLIIFAATSALILAAGRLLRFKLWTALLILVLAFAHIFYFAGKYFSFSEKELVFPQNPILQFIKENQGYFRSWGVGKSFLENNFASLYQLFWPEGYDSLNNRSYGEFTYWMQNGKVEPYTFRADAGLGRVPTVEALANPNRRILLDMVGVKYLIVKQEDFGEVEGYNFKKVKTSGEYGVFENQQVLPRVFLASHYEGPPPYYDQNLTEGEIAKIRRPKIIEKLISADFDWRNAIVLEKPSSLSPQFGDANAEIVSYKPQEVIIKTRSDQPKLLFLSDNYYPGWKAQVDGDVTEILRANYTFRAVPLVPGEHLVRFYYDSDVFKIGLVITGISLLTLLYLVFKKF